MLKSLLGNEIVSLSGVKVNGKKSPADSQEIGEASAKSVGQAIRMVS